MKMLKKIQRNKFLLLCMTLLIACSMTVCVLADAPAENLDKPLLSLGADLKADEKSKVLEYLGIKEAELDKYTVVQVTNKEEYDYLGEYLSSKVIGSRALSSVVVTKKKEGNGLQITTKNISYCTIGMYKNALITAGIKDADIVVAGPFEITGTAALVGIMKAYQEITGEEISIESKDAATNELVVTGQIADSIGDTKKTENLVAMVKQSVLEADLKTPAEIKGAINEAKDALEIDLSEEDVTKLTELMTKITDLDIDTDSLKEQAKDIYDKISNIDTTGLADKIGKALSDFFNSIVDFFKGLFD